MTMIPAPHNIHNICFFCEERERNIHALETELASMRYRRAEDFKLAVEEFKKMQARAEKAEAELSLTREQAWEVKALVAEVERLKQRVNGLIQTSISPENEGPNEHTG